MNTNLVVNSKKIKEGLIMTNLVKRSLRCLVLIALFLGLVPVAMMAAEGDIVVNEEQLSGVVVDYENNTITVSGTATMTGSGTGDAVTINADTTLVFEEGATLTLTGYTNGFVVSGDNAVTLTSANMNITANSQMDVFRLRNNGQLSLTGSNTIIGSGKEGVTNRAIVLEGNNAQNQAITLGANTTLAAHSFYRGLETGGAKNYTISGAGMDSSTFNFSNNNCGMALSYFDQNATFEDCKLEVSNCDASGIFMRQDNAALDGLYIDNVNINCVNDIDLDQTDIAIRFHSNNFTITNSNINIVNAWNTGLWIYDGWNANEQNEIIGTTITVKNVYPSSNTEIYGAAVRKKAITMVPYRDWLISGCTITMEGESNNKLDAGINIGNDMQIQRSGITFTAKPNMYGGTINLQDTTIGTANISIADIGVQIGQFLEIGQNVVINNDYDAENGWAGPARYSVICDTIENKFSAQIMGISINIDYNTTGMSEDTKIDKRVKAVGGSYYSDPNESILVFGKNVYDSSLPVNASGDVLTMFTVTSEAYEAYVANDVIELQDNAGYSYEYVAKCAGEDGNRYIWAPAVTVTFNYADGTVESMEVPRGCAFGLTKDLPEGNWYTSENNVFTAETVITSDMTVNAQ